MTFPNTVKSNHSISLKSKKPAVVVDRIAESLKCQGCKEILILFFSVESPLDKTSRNMKREINFLIVFLISSVFAASFQSNHAILSKPDAEKCKSRPIDFTINGRNYFYSDNHEDTEGLIYSWSEARSKCQKYCMDTISIETQKEFDVVKKLLQDDLIGYIWTSGHACDNPKCLKDEKFQPPNNWYWVHNDVQLPPTDRTPPGWNLNPWSHTGYKKLPQPDNAEYWINGKNETCLS